MKGEIRQDHDSIDIGEMRIENDIGDIQLHPVDNNVNIATMLWCPQHFILCTTNTNWTFIFQKPTNLATEAQLKRKLDFSATLLFDPSANTSDARLGCNASISRKV